MTDLGKEYGGWPLNDMERSYKFMIRHVRLWKVAFHGTSPRWVHGMYLAALAYYYAKYARTHFNFFSSVQFDSRSIALHCLIIHTPLLLSLLLLIFLV